MKKTISLLCILIFGFGFSQSQADIGKIQLSISFSDDDQYNYDTALISKIEGKITQLLSNNGIISTDYNSGFILQPKIIINSNDVVEGGMQNINVTNMTLQLLIKQEQSNLIFSSLSKNIKGTGKNQNLAMSNGINSLSATDPELIAFLEKGKEKILNYYTTNCTLIMTKSSTLEKSGKYEEALALLMSIPEAATCYTTAQAKSIAVYKSYQRKNCASNINQANASIASQDYSSALAFLTDIDTESPCEAQRSQLVKNIENKITAEEKKQWNLHLKIYNDAVSLEKHRINAIKDIAVSYYRSQRRPNQTIIVR